MTDLYVPKGQPGENVLESVEDAPILTLIGRSDGALTDSTTLKWSNIKG